MPKSEWPDWQVYLRDRCRCVYCGFDGKHNLSAFCHLEIDHLIPDKTAPYYNNHENKVVACRSCNDLKGTYNPQEGGNKSSDENNRALMIKRARGIILKNQVKRELLDDFLLMLYEIDNPRKS